MCFTQTQATAATCQMIREFEGELSGVLMERICRQWAEWWQMTSSSFVSPLDCLTSFLGISLSRAVSSFGLPVYSSIHSHHKCPKIGHYGRVVFPKVAEAARNARGVPNGLLGFQGGLCKRFRVYLLCCKWFTCTPHMTYSLLQLIWSIVKAIDLYPQLHSLLFLSGLWWC